MTSVLERRLREEWALVLDLARLNQHRLRDMRAEDTIFFGTLSGVEALPVVPAAGIASQGAAETVSSHPFRVQFPLHFPAVPMELYLQTPVQHPNIHPETGFVCLWDRHRASNSVEIAVHRLAAMLAGRLHNAAAPHVMQPEALRAMQAEQPFLLKGVRHTAADALPVPAAGRRRLS